MWSLTISDDSNIEQLGKMRCRHVLIVSARLRTHSESWSWVPLRSLATIWGAQMLTNMKRSGAASFFARVQPHHTYRHWHPNESRNCWLGFHRPIIHKMDIMLFWAGRGVLEAMQWHQIRFPHTLNFFENMHQRKFSIAACRKSPNRNS